MLWPCSTKAHCCLPASLCCVLPWIQHRNDEYSRSDFTSTIRDDVVLNNEHPAFKKTYVFFISDHCILSRFDFWIIMGVMMGCPLGIMMGWFSQLSVALDVWSPHDPKTNWLCPLDGCLVLSWRMCDPRNVCKRKFGNGHSFYTFPYSQRIYGTWGPFNEENQQLWGRHFILMVSLFFFPSNLYIFFSPSHTQSGVLLLPLTALIRWCLETTV